MLKGAVRRRRSRALGPGRGLQRRRAERLAKAFGVAMVDFPVRRVLERHRVKPVGQPWKPDPKRSVKSEAILERRRVTSVVLIEDSVLAPRSSIATVFRQSALSQPAACSGVKWM